MRLVPTRANRCQQMVGHLASSQPLSAGLGGKGVLMGCTRRTTGPTGTLPLPTEDHTHTHSWMPLTHSHLADVQASNEIFCRVWSGFLPRCWNPLLARIPFFCVKKWVPAGSFGALSLSRVLLAAPCLFLYLVEVKDSKDSYWRKQKNIN